MREFAPTLIRTSAVVAPASTGGVIELNFNFGNLEGARILAVEYGGSAMLPNATGYLEAGLNFNGTVAAPAAANDILLNENVFAFVAIDLILATSGATGQNNLQWTGLDKDLVIARNIALQVFTVGTTSGLAARVYYRRVIFTEAEVGGVIAFRR